MQMCRTGRARAQVSRAVFVFVRACVRVCVYARVMLTRWTAAKECAQETRATVVVVVVVVDGTHTGISQTNVRLLPVAALLLFEPRECECVRASECVCVCARARPAGEICESIKWSHTNDCISLTEGGNHGHHLKLAVASR